MTTVIEDNELNTELQELYLKSKEWISELEFLESDLDFLKKLFGRTFSPMIKNDDYEEIAKILLKAAKVETTQLELKKQIVDYLHKLESLIVEMKQNFDISIVETHYQLELELKRVIQEYKSVKKIVFELTKQGLREVGPQQLKH